MIRHIRRSFYLTLVASLLVHGADWKSSKYAGEFLRTGVGARALGMGGAHTAIASDVTAIYWNPAGLVEMDVLQLHGMHSERFAGIVNWDFLGIGIPLRQQYALGVGLFRLGVDGIPVTDLKDPDRDLGEIYLDSSGRRVRNVPFTARMASDTESALVISLAKRTSATVSFGGNIKLIRKSIDTYSAWGIGFDVGILMHVSPSVRLGCVLMDGTSTLVAWEGGRKEMIRPRLKFGGGADLHFAGFCFTPALDILFGFDDRGSASQFNAGRIDMDLCGGFEMMYADRIVIRSGSDRGRFTAGAGLRVSAFHVDYGFSHHSDLGAIHRVSVTLLFSEKHLVTF